ncbi:MAG: DUF1801 domain-containing protein [Chitinophagaceae bacterium]|nr:DUF1801 domain-containing protein [Chitinophagaceae bacterium]
MQSKATDVDQYINELPEERKAAMKKLCAVIKKNLPKGFRECMNYGMIGYVVPHNLYPAGYHCDPKLPLPFLGLASQKNSINFYHMGVYADQKLLQWLTAAHSKASSKKLDMGKSCMRYKKPEDIPFQLIGELVSKITVQQWIDCYEKNIKR